MAEQSHNINWVTFLLAWVAGFSDTATFVSGDSIFSAHVTGNFIVFAAQVSSGGANAEAWLKLLTFPVFVFAVMAGGWLVEKTARKYKILLAEGIVLMLCGTAAVVAPMLPAVDERLIVYGIVMVTTFGMGLQNAFGKLFAKETHGPTTMMTGNVTQAALDLGVILRKGYAADLASTASFSRQLIVIGGFLAGCVTGALASQWLGLSALLIPGVAVVICYLQGEAVNKLKE